TTARWRIGRSAGGGVWKVVHLGKFPIRIALTPRRSAFAALPASIGGPARAAGGRSGGGPRTAVCGPVSPRVFPLGGRRKGGAPQTRPALSATVRTICDISWRAARRASPSPTTARPFNRSRPPMSEHEQAVGLSDDWYTPPKIFRALGLAFDLDPCSP